MGTDFVDRARLRAIGLMLRRSVVTGLFGLAAMAVFTASAPAMIKPLLNEFDAQYQGSKLADKINTAIKWHCIPQKLYDEWAAQADRLIKSLRAAIDRDRSAVAQVSSEKFESPSARGRQQSNIERLWANVDEDRKIIAELTATIDAASQHICPPEDEHGSRQVNTTGEYYVGLYLSETVLNLIATERQATPPFMQTNEFTDSKDPIGFGLIFGAKYRPFTSNVVVSPFVSFDYLGMSINHTFANGSFLGTRSNVAGTLGVKIGPQFDSGIWLYGIAGASALNEKLQVNFIPVASTTTTTVAGGTAGFGGAWQPRSLQGFGRKVSLFLEYQHTWWQDANFNQPAASPLFNYKFKREDDTVKFGFTVSLSPTVPTVVPAYVKALPAK
jgi:hypothetical protein